MVFKLPKKLTAEQSFIINIPSNRNCIVEGGPGTGKTVMAAYRAIEIAREMKRNREDGKILILVYNKPLCEYLSTEISISGYNNISVSTVSSFLHVMSLPPANRLNFDVFAPCIDDINSSAQYRYKHIIVDEAQDLPPGYFNALSKITENISCFVDSKQITYLGEHSNAQSIAKELKIPIQTLDQNLRNTKEIHDAAQLFSNGKEDLYSDTHGRKPIVYKCVDFNDQIAKMSKIIDSNRKLSIGIILFNAGRLPAKIYNELSKRMLVERGIEIFFKNSNNYTSLDFKTDSIKILSYGTMKGLEFDILLLPYFDKVISKNDVEIDNANIYVAMTRAKKELHIFYDCDDSEQIVIDTISVLRKHKEYFEWC